MFRPALTIGAAERSSDEKFGCRRRRGLFRAIRHLGQHMRLAPKFLACQQYLLCTRATRLAQMQPNALVDAERKQLRVCDALPRELF